jgi:hypothetical protein
VRILVTGSPDWDDPDIVHAALTALTAARGFGHVIVHGGCPTGPDAIVDVLARRWAHLGTTVERHPAQWRRHGRSAGRRRNTAMVHRGADLCLAFIRDSSPDAAMTAILAEEAGIPVVRFLATSGPAHPAAAGSGSGP